MSDISDILYRCFIGNLFFCSVSSFTPFSRPFSSSFHVKNIDVIIQLNAIRRKSDYKKKLDTPFQCFSSILFVSYKERRETVTSRRFVYTVCLCATLVLSFAEYKRSISLSWLWSSLSLTTSFFSYIQLICRQSKHFFS